MEHKTDYVAEGTSLMMGQYRSKTTINNLFAAMLQSKQQIEDAIVTLRDGIMLIGDAAKGQQLDNIGAIVGIERNGLDDTQYRVLIYAKIAENRGDATLQTVLSLALQLFDTDALFEASPQSIHRNGNINGAFVSIMVGSPKLPENLYQLVLKLLQKSLAAGVQLAHLGTFNKTKAFAFAGDAPWVGGFGSVRDAAVGAPFATLIASAND